MLTPESFEEHRSGLKAQEITGNNPPSFSLTFPVSLSYFCGRCSCGKRKAVFLNLTSSEQKLRSGLGLDFCNIMIHDFSQSVRFVGIIVLFKNKVWSKLQLLRV